MARTGFFALIVAAFSWSMSASPAYAQRGMGDPIGMAQRQVLPKLVSLSGKLAAIQTQPCKGGTGFGVVGTHIVLKTDEGKELMVDLGWAKAVEPIVKQLSVGKKINVIAFRTDKMPKGRYVAKSLSFDEKTEKLRDENLRPFWAGRVLNWNGSEKNSVNPIGPGPGRGRGWRRGRGRGRGYGGGRGLGWGRGYGWQYEYGAERGS
ncbi:MAG: hypothetical protein JW818_21115 [Pirellulales bacterium]|nr:hypothetical protein [Pirellulales bacterium]